MDAVLFWDMTYIEIMTVVENYRKKLKEDLQIKAMFTHKLGSLIGIAINDPKKYPSNAKEAFEKMKIFDDEDEPKKQDWQIMKERMNQYAYLRKKRGENA